MPTITVIFPGNIKLFLTKIFSYPNLFLNNNDILISKMGVGGWVNTALGRINPHPASTAVGVKVYYELGNISIHADE